MDIIDVLDNQVFYELVNLDFDEVRQVFNSYDYYVADKDGNQFIAEATQIKADFEKEENKIKEYENNEYCELVKNRRPGFEEEPAYMDHVLRAKTRDLLIGLIEKYFDKATYQTYRDMLVKRVNAKNDTENPLELVLSLLTEKKFIHAFLSIIGYWQRHYNFFLSHQGFWQICKKYTSEVLKMNPELKNDGNDLVWINIFLGDCRIDSDKYIDIDGISYIKLITPYLQTNTVQLIEIVKIIAKCFRQPGENDRWTAAMRETRDYIKECSSKGLMKAL